MSSPRSRTRGLVQRMAGELHQRGVPIDTGVMHVLRSYMASAYEMGWRDVLDRPTVPAPSRPQEDT